MNSQGTMNLMSTSVPTEVTALCTPKQEVLREDVPKNDAM